MSEEHTPEPWTLHTEGSIANIKYTKWHEADSVLGDTSHVARLNDAWICDEHGGTASINGQRIVASVNACAGIPTSALESGVIAEMRAVLDDLLSLTLDAALGEGRELSESEESIRERALALFAKIDPQ
jgi:hypothetical protein